MKFYSLAHSGMFANLKVATHDSAEAAKDWLDARKGIAGEVVGSESDLKTTFGGPALAALYNVVKADDAAPVERFTSKGDGARRCFAALEARYQNQAVEAAAPSTVESTSAANNEEEGADMAAKKTKKAKVAKTPKVKKEKKVRVPKERKGYSTTVKSSGGAASKATALELISRAKGATPEEIAEKLEVSLGTAKNLIWYLRRDGKKIVLGEKSGDRRPYVIG
jgi:ribosomal protein S25